MQRRVLSLRLLRLWCVFTVVILVIGISLYFSVVGHCYGFNYLRRRFHALIQVGWFAEYDRRRLKKNSKL